MWRTPETVKRSRLSTFKAPFLLTSVEIRAPVVKTFIYKYEDMKVVGMDVRGDGEAAN